MSQDDWDCAAVAAGVHALVGGLVAAGWGRTAGPLTGSDPCHVTSQANTDSFPANVKATWPTLPDS